MKSRFYINLKNILTSLFIIGLIFTGTRAFAIDNVLQAVEIDGLNDSYNIILHSDDKADVKKTVQAPNKMILTLTGIRASETINTIYNSANIDSVVVDPINDNSVKIYIQADNVDKADVNFDTLKTPLSGLTKNKPSATQNNNQIVLSKPISDYQPVYNKQDQQEPEQTGFISTTVLPLLHKVKNAISHNKTSALMSFGMMLMFLVLCIKTIKNNEGNIKIGLSQSLKAKELDDYRTNMQLNNKTLGSINKQNYTQQRPAYNNLNSINKAAGTYGLKAYQNTNRSPYMSPEINKKPLANRNSNLALQQAAKAISQKRAIQQAMTNKSFTSPVKTPAAPSGFKAAKKNSSIDSMKFLESMTRIYEKNGRTDLAQGLKDNMKKAKVNLG